MNWRREAACSGADPALFTELVFTEGHNTIHQDALEEVRRRFCVPCRVAEECLRDELELRPPMNQIQSVRGGAHPLRVRALVAHGGRCSYCGGKLDNLRRVALEKDGAPRLWWCSKCRRRQP